MYTPGVFHIAASFLCFRLNYSVCWVFKVRDLVSPLALLELRPDDFLELSPTDFQNQLLWGCIFPVKVSRAGVPSVRIDHLAAPFLGYLSCLQVVPLGVWFLITSLSLVLFLMWSSFYT